MARPIGTDEKLARAVARMTRKDLADARDRLGQSSVELAEQIHGVRTAIKKVRAAARMVGPQMRRAHKENRRLRKIARSVGDLREAEVILGTLDDLGRAWPGKQPESLRKLRAYFSSRLHEAERSFRHGHGFGKIRRSLRRARRRARRWTKTANDWGSVGPGVVEQYRRSRERMAQAYRARSGEAFHAWRRSVKSHRHQVHTLLEIWPQELPHREEELGRLGDLLGEEHDLTVFEAALGQAPPAVIAAADRDKLLTLAHRRRDQRREQAKTIGARLFRESAAAFERRLKAAFEQTRHSD
jgi:CHAD domain-containing protein